MLKKRFYVLRLQNTINDYRFDEIYVFQFEGMSENVSPDYIFNLLQYLWDDRITMIGIGKFSINENDISAYSEHTEVSKEVFDIMKQFHDELFPYEA